ncbi:unnamed protein product [Pedinophyceae sp. YPF-701]|nr:unnamed protein product [Pedinophyceae sp. YPF-701]
MALETIREAQRKDAQRRRRQAEAARLHALEDDDSGAAQDREEGEDDAEQEEDDDGDASREDSEEAREELARRVELDTRKALARMRAFAGGDRGETHQRPRRRGTRLLADGPRSGSEASGGSMDDFVVEVADSPPEVPPGPPAQVPRTRAKEQSRMLDRPPPAGPEQDDDAQAFRALSGSEDSEELPAVRRFSGTARVAGAARTRRRGTLEARGGRVAASPAVVDLEDSSEDRGGAEDGGRSESDVEVVDEDDGAGRGNVFVNEDGITNEELDGSPGFPQLGGSDDSSDDDRGESGEGHARSGDGDSGIVYAQMDDETQREMDAMLGGRNVPEEQAFKAFFEAAIGEALYRDFWGSMYPREREQLRRTVERAEQKLSELRNLCVTSQAWFGRNVHPDFVAALHLLPMMDVHEDPPDGDGEGCEICGRSSHPASSTVTLYGRPYVAKIARDVEMSEIKRRMEDTMNRWEGRQRTMEFAAGRYCKVRVMMYHLLFHHKRNVVARTRRSLLALAGGADAGFEELQGALEKLAAEGARGRGTLHRMWVETEKLIRLVRRWMADGSGSSNSWRQNYQKVFPHLQALQQKAMDQLRGEDWVPPGRLFPHVAEPESEGDDAEEAGDVVSAQEEEDE